MCSDRLLLIRVSTVTANKHHYNRGGVRATSLKLVPGATSIESMCFANTTSVLRWHQPSLRRSGPVRAQGELFSTFRLNSRHCSNCPDWTRRAGQFEQKGSTTAGLHPTIETTMRVNSVLVLTTLLEVTVAQVLTPLHPPHFSRSRHCPHATSACTFKRASDMHPVGFAIFTDTPAPFERRAPLSSGLWPAAGNDS